MHFRSPSHIEAAQPAASSRAAVIEGRTRRAATAAPGCLEPRHSQRLHPAPVSRDRQMTSDARTKAHSAQGAAPPLPGNPDKQTRSRSRQVVSSSVTVAHVLTPKRQDVNTIKCNAVRALTVNSAQWRSPVRRSAGLASAASSAPAGSRSTAASPGSGVGGSTAQRSSTSCGERQDSQQPASHGLGGLAEREFFKSAGGCPLVYPQITSADTLQQRHTIYVYIYPCIP